MVAKIISVVNQKGGAGKTTISMQLAGAFSNLDGYKVLVIDADPQGTATRWAASADEDRPFPATVVNLGPAGKKLHMETKKFLSDYDIIIIDCPPAVESEAPQSALLISDLVLIPVIPSPPDLWATIAIKKLISMVEGVNINLKKLLIMNQVLANTNINKEVEEAITELSLPVAETKISQRTVYRKSSAYGITIFDLGGEASKALNEMTLLTNEIKSILKIYEVYEKQ